jgi:hypothetical protein
MPYGYVRIDLDEFPKLLDIWVHSCSYSDLCERRNPRKLATGASAWDCPVISLCGTIPL